MPNTPALAGDHVEQLRVAVGDVFAEDPDAFVALHLLVQREPDRLAERDGLAAGFRFGRLVDDRRRTDDVVDHRDRVGPGCGERGVGRGAHLGTRFFLQRVDSGGVDGAGGEQRAFHQQDGVVLGLVAQLVGPAVLLLVVGQRVRVRTGHGRVHEHRADAGARVGDGVGAFHSDLEVVATVDGHDVQPANPDHHLRDRRGRLIGRPHRDRVPVVGHHVEHRKVQPGGGAQALPELTFGGGALAERDVGDLVSVRGAAGERTAPDVAGRLRTTDRRKALAARATRLGDDVEVGGAPVARHLAAARCRVVRGTDRFEQHLGGRDPEREGQARGRGSRERTSRTRAATSGRDRAAGPRVRAGDLEERLALLAERDLAIVEVARDEGEAVVAERLFDGDLKRQRRLLQHLQAGHLRARVQITAP